MTWMGIKPTTSQSQVGLSATQPFKSWLIVRKVKLWHIPILVVDSMCFEIANQMRRGSCLRGSSFRHDHTKVVPLCLTKSRVRTDQTVGKRRAFAPLSDALQKKQQFLNDDPFMESEKWFESVRRVAPLASGWSSRLSVKVLIHPGRIESEPLNLFSSSWWPFTSRPGQLKWRIPVDFRWTAVKVKRTSHYGLLNEIFFWSVQVLQILYILLCSPCLSLIFTSMSWRRRSYNSTPALSLSIYRSAVTKLPLARNFTIKPLGGSYLANAGYSS